MNWSTIIIIVFLVMLAVLGHGVWHGPLIGLANVIVTVFTGGRVTG